MDLGRTAEEARHPIEQSESSCLCVAAQRARCEGDGPQKLADLGMSDEEILGVRRCKSGRNLPRYLDEGPVRRRARYLRASPPEAPHATLVGEERDVLAQSRLANPRLAGDRPGARLSPNRGVEVARGVGDLGCAANQGSPLRSGSPRV